MLLEPGPIPQLNPDTTLLQPGPAEFEPLINDVLVDLPALDDDLGVMIAVFDAFDVPPEFDLIDFDLGTSDQGLIDIAALPTSQFVQNASDAKDLATGNLNLVSAELPAEVWQPLPAPMAGSSGTPSHPGVNGPTYLTIDNLSRPGDPNFYSGDSFDIAIQIDSGGGNFDFGGKPLSLVRAHGDIGLGEIPIGTTDQFGRLVYRSTFNDGDVGDWIFSVDPNGYFTDSQVHVHVNQGPAPGGGGGAGGGQALNFTFVNLSTGDISTLHVGDAWQQTITGPAFQPVYFDQIKNGIDQGEIFVGSTDGSGVLTYTGVISALSIGSYIEKVRIADQNVPTQLTFTVVP